LMIRTAVLTFRTAFFDPAGGRKPAAFVMGGRAARPHAVPSKGIRP
jgi:hypothetical protein